MQRMAKGRRDIPMATQEIGGSAYNPTLRERLIGHQAEYTQRLADVTAAIEALDKNPNFEDVMNVIGKVGY